MFFILFIVSNYTDIYRFLENGYENYFSLSYYKKYVIEKVKLTLNKYLT